MGPTGRIDPMTHHTMSGHSTTELHLTQEVMRDMHVTSASGYGAMGHWIGPL